MTGAWRAQVPVDPGLNLLHLEAVIGDKIASKIIEIDNSPFLIEPVASVWSEALDRLLVFDKAHRTLFSLYPESGELRVVSSPDMADGPVPLTPVAMASNDSYAWIFDYEGGRVFEINLLDGERRLLQHTAPGSGISFRESMSNRVVLDAMRNRLLVSDVIDGAIIAVDVSTGNRSYFSSDEIGSGPLFRSPGPLMIDPEGRRLLVVDLYGDGRLLSVDLLTGDRTDIDHVELGGLGVDFFRYRR